MVPLTNFSSLVQDLPILINNELRGRRTLLYHGILFYDSFFRIQQEKLRLLVSNDSSALYFSFLYSGFKHSVILSTHLFQISREYRVLEFRLELHLQGARILLDLVFQVLNW